MWVEGGSHREPRVVAGGVLGPPHGDPDARAVVGDGEQDQEDACHAEGCARGAVAKEVLQPRHLLQGRRGEGGAGEVWLFTWQG